MIYYVGHDYFHRVHLERKLFGDLIYICIAYFEFFSQIVLSIFIITGIVLKP
jgi:hypothetical protein